VVDKAAIAVAVRLAMESVDRDAIWVCDNTPSCAALSQGTCVPVSPAIALALSIATCAVDSAMS
jgi:hypothetical protein